MTTYTNKDKLYALAVCAGNCAKKGDMEKIVSCINTMASIISDEDIHTSKEIFAALEEYDPGGVTVKTYIKAELMSDGSPPPDDPFKAFSA